MDYIQRVDNPKDNYLGWKICFHKANLTGGTDILAEKHVSDKANGGEFKALKVARKWRNKMVKILKKPKNASSRAGIPDRQCRSETDVVGVSHDKERNRYVVSWSEKKKPKKEYFKYPDKSKSSINQAFYLAREFRLSMEELHYNG